jgi:RHS repeat-associated protein
VSVTVIPTNTAYSYDLNGNLLSDGTRNFGYDDENELIAVWQANAWSNNFVYDGKMRRRIERDYIWNTGTSNWLQTNEVHFIYDGNLAVQERNASNLPQVTYTRGKDLSGSLQGAGGIGGLLARTDNTKLMVGDPTALAYYHSDGNGNITCLMTPYQQLAAKYLYDTYGNTLATYGSLATANRYRFSSKEWNENSGLYYYLYRFYDPNLQRWPNRDPVLEEGFEASRWGNMRGYDYLFQVLQIQPTDGPNLYDFVINDPIDEIDNFGLSAGGAKHGPYGPRPPSPPGTPPNHPINPYGPRPHPGSGCHTKADCDKQALSCADVGYVVCGLGAGATIEVPIVGVGVGVACEIAFNHICDKQKQDCYATASDK